jgi:hypothetical protein
LLLNSESLLRQGRPLAGAAGRRLLNFEYVLLKLFDYKAWDYYDHPNPVVKILLPKMDYEPKERAEVIRQAYRVCLN